MATGRRPLVAGNWKMNGRRADGRNLIEGITAALRGGAGRDADVLVCPPFTLIAAAAAAAEGSALQVGAQDCHVEAHGAHTGDISAEMIRDAGASWVIVGHSERRSNHGETDFLVHGKAEAARRAGLGAIICIGETLAEREAGKTLDVLSSQLAGSVPKGAAAAATVIAYEPVWAIGTGRTPAVPEVAAAHAHIRKTLKGLKLDAEAIRILYGGSVKGSNAPELLGVADVDGALVGGASLIMADFLAIIGAAGAR